MNNTTMIRLESNLIASVEQAGIPTLLIHSDSSKQRQKPKKRAGSTSQGIIEQLKRQYILSPALHQVAEESLPSAIKFREELTGGKLPR